MKVIDLAKKAITSGEWFIAYRLNSSSEYRIVSTTDEQWYADPFVFEHAGNHFIFVEQYRKDLDKGCIGYFSFENEMPVNKGIIIENSYHMSYPDVFVYSGNVYMIPESSANNTVDIYIAERFPDKWKRISSLITGKKYVDSTVYQDGDKYYLICYTMVRGYEIQVFELDMENLKLKILSKKHYDKNVARPGGRLWVEDGKLMRPAQDCTRKYGEAIIIYQVDNINHNGEYVEHEIKRVEPNNLMINKKPDRIHQYTFNEKFEVIDIFMEKIDLFRAPKIMLRARRK